MSVRLYLQFSKYVVTNFFNEKFLFYRLLVMNREFPDFFTEANLILNSCNNYARDFIDDIRRAKVTTEDSSELDIKDKYREICDHLQERS